CRRPSSASIAWPSSAAGRPGLPATPGSRCWNRALPEPRLDPGMDAAYRAGMDSPEVIARLHALAARVDALAARAQQLAEENRSLRQQQEQLSGERAQLLAKNEQARSRVEAMIARLKSLEQHT